VGCLLGRLPGALAAGSIALLAACSGSGEGGAGHGGPGGGMPPAVVSVIKVEAKTLPAEFEYAGQAVGSREVEVRARVAGILLQRGFREGGAVRKGQMLYRLDPAPFQAAAERLAADQNAAEVRAAQAARTLARAKSLFDSRIVTQREFDDASSADAIARAEVLSARARLREARLSLGYTQVNAPINGVISRSLQSEGTLVTGPDMLLATIAQVDPIEIRFGIPDTDQLRWREDVAAGRLVLPRGGAFTVRITLADGTLLPREGRLQFTEARVSAATGTNEAQAEIANGDGALKPGHFVRVRLGGASRPDAITVPTRAVLEGPQGRFVYLLQEGKAQPRPVKVGEQLGDRWLVREGLAAGDEVIVDGVMRIGPGAPVQLAPPPPPGAPGSAASGRVPAAAASAASN
jgi:membrane fusion protein (multidrug efflux system)